MNIKTLKKLEDRYLSELRAVDASLKTYLEDSSDLNESDFNEIDKLIEKIGSIQMKMGKVLGIKRITNGWNKSNK